jgi:hypothetical protein
LPAQGLAKKGSFLGVAGPVDQMKMARSVLGMADTISGDITKKEEIIVDFGDGSAAIGFGEMIKIDDGSYVYKDKAKIKYGPTLSQVDCERLDPMTTLR